MFEKEPSVSRFIPTAIISLLKSNGGKSLIVIEDSEYQSSHLVLEYIIREIRNQVKNINYQSSHVSEKGKDDQSVFFNSFRELENLCAKKEDEADLIVIDSYSDIAWEEKDRSLLKLLADRRTNVLIRIRKDLHGIPFLRCLESMASFCISVKNAAMGDLENLPKDELFDRGLLQHSNSGTSGIIQTSLVSRTRASKTLYKDFSYVFNDAEDSFQCFPLTDSDYSRDALNDTNPVVSSTFNLDLTDSQRKAKDNLQLPHFRAQTATGAINTLTSSSSASIHYSLEVEDDFDDEDPDMDLEI